MGHEAGGGTGPLRGQPSANREVHGRWLAAEERHDDLPDRRRGQGAHGRRARRDGGHLGNRLPEPGVVEGRNPASQSNDYRDHPFLDYNLLDHDEDLRRSREGVRLAVGMEDHPDLAALIDKRVCPEDSDLASRMLPWTFG